MHICVILGCPFLCRVVHFDDECSGGTAAVRIARMFEVYNPDVVLGGECDLGK